MFGFYVYKYSLYSIVYIGIALAGIINAKYLETLFLFISFVALRYCFPKTFHCKNVWHCVFWSIVVFWVGIPSVLPVSISIFFSVIVGYLITYFLYLIEDYIEKKEFHMKHTNFTLENATREQIEHICKSLHYTRDKIDLAIMFFVDKLSNKQVFEYMCNHRLYVEYDTILQYRYRMKKDLIKFVEDL
jgi:hypothetical protein